MIIVMDLICYHSGIYLSKDKIDLIISGKKNIYARTTCFKELLGKDLLLMDSKYTYGIINFKRPKQYMTSKLRSLPEYSRILHNYSSLDIPILLHPCTFTKFKTPALVVYNHESYFNEYIPKVCLVTTVIKDICTYNPSKVSDVELIEHHLLVHLWHETKVSGHDLKHSIDDLVNLHNLIVTEILTRGYTHDKGSNLTSTAVKTSNVVFNLCIPFTPPKTSVDSFHNIDDLVNYLIR